jgi:ABC-type transport system involved in multi-copper enzyme maturation permease subunit
MNAILAIARFSFVRRASGMRLIGPSIIALLPTAMMAIVLIDAPMDAFDLYRSYMVPATLYFVLPLVCMFIMLPILSDLYEKGAIGYLFTRPVPRWKVLVGLFLGGVAATLPVFLIAVLAPALLGLVSTDATPIMDWLSLGFGITCLLWLAALAYGSICLFLGVKTKRPILWAFVWLVGFGSTMGSLPGEGQAYSLHYYLISLAYRWCGITAAESNLFSPLESVASVGKSVLILLAVTAGMLWLTSWAARRRDIL